MIKGLIVLALSFSAMSTFAARYEIPADDKVLYSIGTCEQESLPANFQLFVWNIKKAEALAAWEKDFETFAPKSDIFLIQEAMMDSFMPGVVGRQKHCWGFASSFLDQRKFATGVMNGSFTAPTMTHYLRSTGREPVIKTPKMILVNEYPIANSVETLWVANIHGLNFTSDNDNRVQIEQALEFLKRHQGPLIFAGDFNTWNTTRLIYLDRLMKEQGLSKLPMPNDRRTFKLDHIYVRGLEATDIELHSNIRSSDHFPLSAVFRLK